MSTQTQFTAESAEEFLKKYATVVGTNKAIKDKNSEFLLKHTTVVGSPEAVATYIPAEPAAVSDNTDNTPTETQTVEETVDTTDVKE